MKDQQRNKRSGPAETHGKEIDEALSAAAKVFDDLAQKQPLPPYAEWARDWLLEARGNPVEFIEMFSGPDLEYSWFAKVTRDPTPQGLEQGRVRSFDLLKIADPPTREAPDLSDGEKYEQWLKDLPRDIHIAGYHNGKLTRHVDGPQTDTLIAEIKETCADFSIERGPRSSAIREALSAARGALDNLEREQGLSPDAKRARDLCSGALQRIEQSRDAQRDRKGASAPGKEGAIEKDDALLRAMNRVKQKQDKERQADARGHGREQSRE